MARRKHGDRQAPLETEIMNAHWEISPATAPAVRRLEREPPYTTERTALNVKEARDGND